MQSTGFEALVGTFIFIKKTMRELQRFLIYLKNLLMENEKKHETNLRRNGVKNMTQYIYGKNTVIRIFKGK